MRFAGRVLLAALLACAIGCRAAPPPAAADTGSARILELEERIARLEAAAMTTNLHDEVLALEVERAGLWVTYAPEHAAILKIDGRIETLRKLCVEEDRARRDRLLSRLEVERSALLVTYTPDHDKVRKVDAQIAFLREDAR